MNPGAQQLTNEAVKQAHASLKQIRISGFSESPEAVAILAAGIIVAQGIVEAATINNPPPDPYRS